MKINSPFPIINDTDGTPLDAGFVYIGTAGQPAESAELRVYWDSDLLAPAEQPVRTLNGYLSREGAPGKLHTATAVDYSMTVRNKRGELVWSSLNVTNETESETATADLMQVNNVASLRATPVVRDQNIYRKYHSATLDGGGLHFIGMTGSPVGTWVDNNGTIIVPTGGDGSAAWVASAPIVSTAAFGGNGGTSSDKKTQLINALTYGSKYGVKIIAAPGTILLSGPVVVSLASGPLDFEIPADSNLLKSSAWSGDVLQFTDTNVFNQPFISGMGKVNDAHIAQPMGNVVSNADAAITGYVLVKDKAGNDVKLAVIA